MARRKAALLSLGVVGAMLAWGTPAVAAPVPTPTVHAGDVTSCDTAGLGGSILATAEALAGGTAPDVSQDGVTVDVNQLPGPLQDREITVTLKVDYHMTGVVVVGGGASHVYTTFLSVPESLAGLVAPPESGTNPIISRYIVCGGKHLEAVQTTHEGDVTTCEAAGLSGTIHASGETAPGDVAPPDFGSVTTGATVDVNGLPGDPFQGRELSVRPEFGHTMSGIVVAGGGRYNLYSGPFAGPTFIPHLTAPAQGLTFPVIEHYFVCGGPNSDPEPTDTDPGTTTTTTPALADTGETLSRATMIGIISAGTALVAIGATLLLVLRRRRAVTSE